MKIELLGVALSLAALPLHGQTTLFDFENATLSSSLPLGLKVGGITALFTETGPGFSVQQADSLGPAPVGFSGKCLLPKGVSASDLLISFSQVLSDFSILYAPDELACDSSARMKVTALLSGVPVATNTTTATPVPTTWPSATLSVSAPEGFNSVVVHYDAPPPTGGDYNPIFMVDNMRVTPRSPTLRIQSTKTNSVVVAWPLGVNGFTLQQNPTITTPDWVSVTNAVKSVGSESQVTIATTEAAQFYRLFRP